MQRKGTRRIKWLAVLAGWMLDLFLSALIVGIALMIDPDLADQNFLAGTGSVVLGVLLVSATAVGGWLAARLAKQERVLHGVLVGGMGIFMLLFESIFDTPPPLDSIVLQFVATVLAGVGGYISRWLPMRQQEN